jgi:hypothetical protein
MHYYTRALGFTAFYAHDDSYNIVYRLSVQKSNPFMMNYGTMIRNFLGKSYDNTRARNGILPYPLPKSTGLPWFARCYARHKYLKSINTMFASYTSGNCEEADLG